jgi:dTDP-4-amino-4,6-dideoxygalactose transaminase
VVDDTAITIPVNDLAREAAQTRSAVRAAAMRVLDSGWFVLGREVERFEREFAAYCGSRHCVGVANGTDALELALRAAHVRPGQRVATVANAGMYASAAILAVGATPLYVDVEPEHLLLDPAALAGLEPGDVQAIIVTHLYGCMADADAVMARARELGAVVVEDCAQAHGAMRSGRRAGTTGALGCFSFYPTKNLGAAGDAGAVVTGDDEMAAELRRLRQYGWTSKYRATSPGGRNSRLDEMQAAILLAKLPLLDGWNARRRAIARAYSEGIRNAHIDVASRGADDDVAHLYVVKADQRDALRSHLAAHGVGSDVHYPIPDHRQPALFDIAHDALAVTEAACQRVLSLPCFPELRDDEVQRVIDACNRFSP